MSEKHTATPCHRPFLRIYTISENQLIGEIRTRKTLFVRFEGQSRPQIKRAGQRALRLLNRRLEEREAA